MEEILQILREEETTSNLPNKTRVDGINAEAFYPRRKNEKQTRLVILAKTQITRQRTVIIETRTLQVQAKETIRLEMDTYLQLPIEKKNFVRQYLNPG
ncbi:hypothetical protein TNCV_2359211 [Trichonephila clavipes]|nr:hypothetical protein TNCV_2359211 [Trichonephila clavipes]